ncbi:UNVERIFIED_CONTAM: Ubiquitin-associated domain-containing protein 1 [Gekko kuhli]
MYGTKSMMGRVKGRKGSRNPPQRRKLEQKAPDKEAILKATTSLPSHSMDRSMAHHSMRDPAFPVRIAVTVPRNIVVWATEGQKVKIIENLLLFQTELRKILVSLIEVAQKLLALNPDAVELFKKANAMLDEDEDDRVDEIALRQLTEMGFPESRAAKALRLSQ